MGLVDLLRNYLYLIGLYVKEKTFLNNYTNMLIEMYNECDSLSLGII